MSRGLFLDLDGTLADSHGMLARCYERLVVALGVGHGPPEFETVAALTLPEVVERLRPDAAPDVAGEFLRRYESWVQQGYAEVRPHAGASELLAWARAEGIRAAVVTSGAEAPSTRWLAAHGLLRHVDLVVGRHAVRATKPDPEPYRHALAATGCTAAASIAVEDSPGGARAAVGAGLPTYVLGPTPADRSDWPAVAGFLATLLDVREHFR